MREQDRRRDLRQRQNPAYDRVVVACRTNGQLLALVQAAGKAPARLVLESEEMLLHGGAERDVGVVSLRGGTAHPRRLPVPDRGVPAGR
jgi:hypothetical protein